MATHTGTLLPVLARTTLGTRHLLAATEPLHTHFQVVTSRTTLRHLVAAAGPAAAKESSATLTVVVVAAAAVPVHAVGSAQPLPAVHASFAHNPPSPSTTANPHATVAV